MKKIDTLDDIREFEKFSNHAKRAIVESFEIARDDKSSNVNPRHLFIGILLQQSSMARKVIEKMGVDVFETIRAIRSEMSLFEPSAIVKGMSDDFKSVLTDSLLIANELGHVYAGTEHILLAILKLKNYDFVVDFEVAGITYSSLKDVLLSFGTYQQGFFGNKSTISNVDDIEGDEESALDVFAEDMNEKEKLGKYLPVFGRDDETERLIHILSRRTKSNPILVGEAGVGKTAIVEGLVQRINQKKVPISFQNKRIVNLDIAGILAGSKIRGDVEERILDVVKEASEDNHVILFIDEIHMIVGAGSAGQGSMDIANILKPHLTNGSISVIGSTTYNEYQQYFESDNALSRRFQPVFVSEISVDESIELIKNLKSKLEDYHGVTIENNAVDAAVRLSQRYITDRYLPDKAIDVIDEAAAGLKIKMDNKSKKYFELVENLDLIRKMKNDSIEINDMDKASKLRKKEVELTKKIELVSSDRSKQKASFILGEDDVRKVVSRFTKIPVDKMDKDSVVGLINLEKDMRSLVIGQDDAIARIVSSIKRAKVGIGDLKRPMASFMFVGPSGVGKTQTAKVIAKQLFGREESIIQLDMSEYMEQHSVSKLIGSPPGYVGFQDGGQFTEKIRRNPYSVVLLDEIEKAHPDLLNILLQILEEGQIKDSKGRLVNFKNTIIIMTSNLGVREVVDSKVLGFNLDGDPNNDSKKKEMDREFESIREKIMSSLKSELKPEFLNRIDDIIVFKGLTDSDAIKIVKLEISKLNQRLDERNIIIAVTSGAIEYIAKEGISREYGARNIRRKIQELIENPLANKILDMGMLDNSRKISVRVFRSSGGIDIEVN